jgi:MFS family permease
MSESYAVDGSRRSNIGFWALVALGVGAAIAALGSFVGWWDWQAVFWGIALWLSLIALIALYFVPTAIAVKRKHRSIGAIVALNILAGWSFIGWLVALVWSLSSTQQQVVVQQFAAPLAVQYQVGDVVNGHRWDGQAWRRVP